MKALALQVEFDPGTLKVVDVNAGDALKRNNAQVQIDKVIDQPGGNVSVNLSGMGAEGKAGVVSFTFEVTAPALETSVSVDSISASGSNGEALSVTAPEPHAITLAQ